MPRAPPDLDHFPRDAVQQGYLIVAADKSEVRLRRMGAKRVLTYKGPGTLQRREIEIELDEAQFERLWPATEGMRLGKMRYRIPWRGRTIELDLFEDALAGLALAEVEFGSRAESEAFAPPEWFGREVTEDPRYKNQTLAREGKP